MIRPWMIFGGVLVLSLGASWMRLTGDEITEEKDGVVLLAEKPDALTSVAYTSADLDVLVEMRADTLGRYGWVTVTDHKQKKAKEGEAPPPVETKITTFKAGSAADKLFDLVAPMRAMRELTGVDEQKLGTFGLKDSVSSLAVTGGGTTATLDLGGETYGAKDLYARHRETTRYYVVDDELIKPLKFAATRLPERNLFGAAIETIDRVSLGQGGKTVVWTQHNKEDRNADWWERMPTPGTDEVGKKDETFANWLEKGLKLKSQSYVQTADVPATTAPVFALTFSITGKPDETLHVTRLEDSWYASSDFTRGLVKLTKSTVEDTADEVDDIIDGREPPPKEKKTLPEPGEGPPIGGPPGMPPGPPGMPPHLRPPGLPSPGKLKPPG